MRILPIGSIVEFNSTKVLIVGYAIYTENEEVITGYYVTKYPGGFAGMKSLGVLQADQVNCVIKEGYKSDLAKKYTESLTQFANSSKNIKANEWENLIKALNKKVETQKMQ